MTSSNVASPRVSSPAVSSGAVEKSDSELVIDETTKTADTPAPKKKRKRRSKKEMDQLNASKLSIDQSATVTSPPSTPFMSPSQPSASLTSPVSPAAASFTPTAASPSQSQHTTAATAPTLPLAESPLADGEPPKKKKRKEKKPKQPKEKKEQQPIEPKEPNDPNEFIEPMEPTEPNDPTEPIEPNESTEPNEPIEPTEPEEPEEPKEKKAKKEKKPKEKKVKPVIEEVDPSTLDDEGRQKLQDLNNCKIIHAELTTHDCSWPFLKPVNRKQFPSYRKYIQTPMDLLTAGKKLNNRSYQHRQEFASDVRLIFNNCETFNEDESDVGKSGFNLRGFFETRWLEIFPDDAN